MLSNAGSAGTQLAKPAWYEATARYEHPDLQKAV